MKKRILALALAGCFLLSGCKAMLERSYSVSTPHVDHPATAEDPSVLRVENYRELVSAVLYLVEEGAEEGTIQLYNSDGEEESDLSAACLEVSTQDPLGAYAVDYIKHELSRVVSYYQATLAIHYRRSGSQREGIVNANGDQAIRERLGEALEDFPAEVVLRTPFFFGDEETVKALLREAYYDHPAAALGFPEAQVTFYPDSGWDRIVEVALTYPEETETLKEKKEELARRAEELLPAGSGLDEESAARMALTVLYAQDGAGAVYDPEGGSTTYAALVEGKADSEGMALAYALLCARENVECQVAEGSFQDQPWFWNILRFSTGESACVDASFFSQRSTALFTEEEFLALGYFFPET